jgi:uncharacterized protein YndB with AHSA1/START domain
MKDSLTAQTQITIHASPSAVWHALTTPALVKKYLMGANVKSDWKVGSSLTYTGEYRGKAFEEKGVIQKIVPERVLQATHFSSMSGKEDRPENYALVTWELEEKEGGNTLISVSQEGISNAKGVEQSRANWTTVLRGLKETVEG